MKIIQYKLVYSFSLLVRYKLFLKPIQAMPYNQYTILMLTHKRNALGETGNQLRSHGSSSSNARKRRRPQ